MNTCLVDVEDGVLAMHDQLQDLAWAIVRNGGDALHRSRVRGKTAEAVLRNKVSDTTRLLQSINIHSL